MKILRYCLIMLGIFIGCGKQTQESRDLRTAPAPASEVAEGQDGISKDLYFIEECLEVILPATEVSNLLNTYNAKLSAILHIQQAVNQKRHRLAVTCPNADFSEVDGYIQTAMDHINRAHQLFQQAQNENFSIWTCLPITTEFTGYAELMAEAIAALDEALTAFQTALEALNTIAASCRAGAVTQSPMTSTSFHLAGVTTELGAAGSATEEIVEEPIDICAIFSESNGPVPELCKGRGRWKCSVKATGKCAPGCGIFKETWPGTRHQKSLMKARIRRVCENSGCEVQNEQYSCVCKHDECEYKD